MSRAIDEMDWQTLQIAFLAICSGLCRCLVAMILLSLPATSWAARLSTPSINRSGSGHRGLVGPRGPVVWGFARSEEGVRSAGLDSADAGLAQDEHGEHGQEHGESGGGVVGLTEQVLARIVVTLGAWSRPPDVSDVNRRFGCIFYGRSRPMSTRFAPLAIGCPASPATRWRSSCLGQESTRAMSMSPTATVRLADIIRLRPGPAGTSVRRARMR